MEKQKELETEIGTKEMKTQTLQPTIVKIVKVEINLVEKAKSKKVNCFVKHPDREEPISISSVSLLIDKAIETKGLWYNTDEEENIQKGSPLADFLVKNECKTLKDLQGKELETELSGNWLVFKCY